MKPKAVLLTMFEPGADTEGELAVFRKKENLQKIDLPGIDHLYGDPQRGLFSLLTGVGTASTAVSVMALVLGSGWDFSETLWIVCGISGGNPAQCSLGSAVWADWAVDGDLAHEIDPREAPEDWPTGIFPLGTRAPYAPTRWYEQLQGPAYQVFRLHRPTTDWAYALTKDIPLLAPPELTALRHGYPQYPAANTPPAVLRGATLSAARYWHGELANTWATQWVRYWTRGEGIFTTSAMEDTGTLLALCELARMGRTNKERVLILRTVSNYTTPPQGISAADNICDENTNHLPAMAAALENGYRVVKRVLDAVL